MSYLTCDPGLELALKHGSSYEWKRLLIHSIGVRAFETVHLSKYCIFIFQILLLRDAFHFRLKMRLCRHGNFAALRLARIKSSQDFGREIPLCSRSSVSTYAHFLRLKRAMHIVRRIKVLKPRFLASKVCRYQRKVGNSISIKTCTYECVSLFIASSYKVHVVMLRK